jgi:hypothetical protein
MDAGDQEGNCRTRCDATDKANARHFASSTANALRSLIGVNVPREAEAHATVVK